MKTFAILLTLIICLLLAAACSPPESVAEVTATPLVVAAPTEAPTREPLPPTAAPTATATPLATEAVATEPASDAPVAKPDGSFAGEVRDGQQRYPIHLSLTICAPGKRCGVVNYPDLACRGAFKFERQEGQALIYSEEIEEGGQACPGGPVHLAWTDDGGLALSWVDAGGGRARTAQLQPVDPSVLRAAERSLFALDQALWESVLSGWSSYPIVNYADSLWVALANRTAIVRLDPATGAVQATIEAGVRPNDSEPWAMINHGLAVHDGMIWVAQPSADRVSAIDPATNEVAREIELECDAYDLVSDGASLWVSCFDDRRVVRVDTTSDTVTAVIEPVRSPTGIAAGGGYIWAGEHRYGALVQIDPNSNSVIATISLGSAKKAENVIYAFDYVWVPTNQGQILARVDPQTHDVLPIAVDGYDAMRVAAGPDAIWVALWPTGVEEENKTTTAKFKVAAIEPSSGTVIQVYDAPHAFSVLPDEDHLWLTQANYTGNGKRDQIVRVALPRP